MEMFAAENGFTVHLSHDSDSRQMTKKTLVTHQVNWHFAISLYISDCYTSIHSELMNEIMSSRTRLKWTELVRVVFACYLFGSYKTKRNAMHLVFQQNSHLGAPHLLKLSCSARLLVVDCSDSNFISSHSIFITLLTIVYINICVVVYPTNMKFILWFHLVAWVRCPDIRTYRAHRMNRTLNINPHAYKSFSLCCC